MGYGPSQADGANDLGLVIGGAGVLPVLNSYGPGGDASRFTDVTLIGSHVLPITTVQNENTVDQVKLEGAWTEDDLAIKFGFHYLNNEFQLRNYNSFANNNWQAYGGYGPNSNNDGGVDLPDNLFTPFSIGSGFINGWSAPGGESLPPGLIAYDPYAVIAYLEGLGNPQVTPIPGFNTSVDYDGMYRIAEDAGAHRDIKEETMALFLSVADETTLADRPLRFSTGVRYEETEVTSVGIGQLPTALTQIPGDLTAFNVSFTSASDIEGTNKYRCLLPNLDVNWELTPTVKLRFDAARTLSRAPLNRLNPTLNVGVTQRVGALTASGGNLGLLPYLADNIDLGIEWCYADNSYMSAAVFAKEVTNFVVGGTTTQTINDVIDPTTSQLAEFSVTTFVNGPSAQITGLEVALQHLFGDTGFGLQANATVVDTDKPYDETDISQSGFAVTGLANSANLVAFYENFGFQARLAVNWRDEFQEQFGQRQNTSAFGSEPTFVDSATHVDFSASYDVNDHVTLYFEGLNLTDETYSTHGRYSEQVLDVIDTGSRFTFGARARF